MKVSEFSYQLPERLIADYPMAQRSASRLLSLNVAAGSIEHGKFPDITQFLTAKDLLVFNNTRVIPARLYARKETGGSAEILVERVLGMGRLLAQIRASKSPKPGSRLILVKSAENEIDSEASLQPTLQVIGRREEFFELELVSEGELGSVLEAYGHMPLPPYIKRQDQALDKDRYQTVYASEAGAVAAPTAGLHFDESLLERLSVIGVSTAFLTLHVGAGTFQPVRAESIDQHRMHSERIELDQSVCDAIAACKARGGRVVAVGTTSVRSLESAASSGVLKPFHGETDIFIYPGYKFQVVDAMITNFHLPESTLLMLVSAFASKRMILDAYEEAIREEYRFFSYGDAMFLHRN